MEIPAWLFISFWAIISFTFLHLGFHALDKTELSNSVSPVVMFLFKHSLAVSSCFSSCYALKFRAQSRDSVRSNLVLLVYVLFSVFLPRTIEGILIGHALKAIFAWLLEFLSKLNTFSSMIFQLAASLFVSLFRFLWRRILPISGFVFFLPLLLKFISNPSLNSLVTMMFSFLVGILFQTIYSYTLGWLVSATEFLWAPIFTFIFYLGCHLLFCVFADALFLVFKDNFSELKARSAINVSDDRLSDGLVHIASRFVYMKMEEVLTMLRGHKVKKFIEFAVGTVGAILFHNFFRITSFSEVAAFLYFAVMWLANLVMLGFCGDVGVFNFSLANVVVGCTVGQFGLHGATWIAFGAALLLYALRLKLDSLYMVYGEGQLIQVSIFGDD